MQTYQVWPDYDTVPKVTLTMRDRNDLGPAKIGILGLGTVGCGTVNVLTRNADEISRRAGREIVIAAACGGTPP